MGTATLEISQVTTTKSIDVPVFPLSTHVSVSEYLSRERAALEKSEYINGEMRQMAGASLEHNIITGNLITELNIAVRNREECIVLPSDIRLRIPTTNRFTYPDLVVVCGDKPRFTDSSVDTLLNPTTLVEVLSPSTSDYDRGDKFANYRSIHSLQEYVLVTQDSPRIEVYSRPANSDGTQWTYSVAEGLDATAMLPAISVSLALRDVYRKVTLPEPSIISDVEPVEITTT